MARVRDLTVVIRRVGFFPFTKKVWAEVNDDNVFMMASALAYAWLFAIFPFLIFLISLLPYLPGKVKDSATRQLRHVLVENLPKKAEDVVDSVNSFMDAPKGSLLSIGLLVTVWTASGGMAMTMGALDTAYDAPFRRKYFVQRPLAMLLTVVIATLIIVVMVLLPVGSVARDFAWTYGDRWLQQLGWSPKLLAPILLVWDLFRFSLSFILMFTVLAVMYHWGTAAKTRLSFFSPGAVFCVVVWIVLGMLFRFYVDKFGKYEKTYGTVGGVAIVLLFFYIDAVVLLIGAEINSEVEVEAEKERLSLFPEPSANAPAAAGDVGSGTTS